MNVLLLLAVYCVLIVLASLLGGRLSTLFRMTHLRTQLLMSGVGGLMLGIAMLHLIPHATETLGSASRAGIGALVGLTVMFLMVRLFHTHDHSIPVVEPDENGQTFHAGCDHGDAHHSLHHHNDKNQDDNQDHVRGISWTGLFFGLMLHTLVDGVALAASVLAESEHGTGIGLGGLGTFLAVALHKPLDAFAITSVMNRQRWSTRAQWFANVTFAMACPIGAFAFYFGVSTLVTQPDLLGWGLAVSAGFFIGIALADLLPEVAFHDHDRGKLTAAFLLGIAVAVCIENLPGHDHATHSHGPDSTTSEPHSHAGHDHAGHDHDEHR